MNPIEKRLVDGTLGELLVQARLLCYDVQAAPPLKDTGNDLIALRRRVVRSIQVKATDKDAYQLPRKKRIYDILAVVRLSGGDNFVDFQASKIYLIPKEALGGLSRQFDEIEQFAISQGLVDYLFPLAD